MSCFLDSAVQEDPVANHYSFQALQVYSQPTTLTQVNTPPTSNMWVILQPGEPLPPSSYPSTMPWGQEIASSSGQSTPCRNTFLQLCSSNLYKNPVLPRPGKMSGHVLCLDVNVKLGCHHADVVRTGCPKCAYYWEILPTRDQFWFY